MKENKTNVTGIVNPEVLLTVGRQQNGKRTRGIAGLGKSVDGRQGRTSGRSAANRQDPGVFTESDVLTPAMRCLMSAFYDKVDVDLFESEHQAHMKLCRDLAEAARKRGEAVRARKIDRKARAWAERHYAAFVADSLKEAVR